MRCRASSKESEISKLRSKVSEIRNCELRNFSDLCTDLWRWRKLQNSNPAIRQARKLSLAFKLSAFRFPPLFRQLYCCSSLGAHRGRRLWNGKYPLDVRGGCCVSGNKLLEIVYLNSRRDLRRRCDCGGRKVGVESCRR